MRFWAHSASAYVYLTLSGIALTLGGWAHKLGVAFTRHGERHIKCMEEWNQR